MGFITALGVATGPAIGSLIVDSFGWRWAFLVLPPFCLLAYVSGKSALPANAPNDKAFRALLAPYLCNTRRHGTARFRHSSSWAVGLDFLRGDWLDNLVGPASWNYVLERS